MSYPNYDAGHICLSETLKCKFKRCIAYGHDPKENVCGYVMQELKGYCFHCYVIRFKPACFGSDIR